MAQGIKLDSIMTERNFVRKKVKSHTLGEKLRQLREDRRLRVQDLSHKINVKATYIDALEKGAYDDLPTKVYVKGFVRSYARFFGVPEDVLINLFEREYSVYRNINNRDQEETVNKLPKVPRFVLTPRIIIGFFGFVVLACVGIYLYFGIDNFVSSPWLIIESPADQSVVESDVVVIQGKTRSNSRVSINGQQTFVDIDGAFSDEIGLAPGINVIRVNSINKFNKESSVEVIVDARYEIEQKKEVSEETVKLFIKARRAPVWINVVVDGIDMYNDTIQIDDVKEFSAVEKIVITTSNGNDTLYSVDDDVYNVLSDDDGVVQNWTFPEAIDENNTESSAE